MKASMLHAIVVIGVLSAATALLAQGTVQPGYNPDKMQTPNSKPGSRTQDGMMGVTGTHGATGNKSNTGNKGTTGPTGHRGSMGYTGVPK